MYSAHSHPPNPLKVVADILKARLYAAAEDPTNSSKFLYHEAVHLASFAGSSGKKRIPSNKETYEIFKYTKQKVLSWHVSFLFSLVENKIINANRAIVHSLSG